MAEPTDNEILFDQIIEARRAKFRGEFNDYGTLLGSMSASELAVEIGENFPSAKQAAILAVMLARIVALEQGLK